MKLIKPMLAGLAVVLLAGPIAFTSSASASPRPVVEWHMWSGEDPLSTDVDMLESANTGGGDFEVYDECDSAMLFSCDVFLGGAPLINVPAGGSYPIGSKASWTMPIPSVFGPDAYFKTTTAVALHVTGPTEEDFEQSEPHAYLGVGDGTSFTEAVTNDEGGVLELDQAEGVEGDREIEFGIRSTSSATLTQDHWGGLALVGAFLGDDVDPEFDVDPLDLPSGWVNEDPIEIPYTASDGGLGLKDTFLISTKRSNVNPWNTGGLFFDGWTPDCTGQSSDPCPMNSPSGASFEVDTGQLREGPVTLSMGAMDQPENGTVIDVPIKVDTLDPTINLTGSFTTAPGMVLDGPVYSLHSEAVDGTTDKPNSGVTKIEVLIDEVLIDSDSAACGTQNCELELDTDIEPDDYTNGDHVLKVKATDAVGHVKVRTVDFEVDR